MNGFFHFHEVTVFLAKKTNRAEINEIIKAVVGTIKRAFPEIPMHVKVNIRWVNSDFRFSEGKNIPAEEKREPRPNDSGNRVIPKGFNRRPVSAQL